MKLSFLVIVSLFTPTLLNAQLVQQQTTIKQQWEAIRIRMYEQQDSLLLLRKTFTDSLAHTTEAEIRKVLENKVAQLNIAIESIAEKALYEEFDIVKCHPSSPISLDILDLEFNRREGQPYEMFYTLFYSLSTELRNSRKGKALQEALLHCKSSAVGQSAPGFSVKDSNQDTLSLKMFHNKSYVLIDFWASWCVPCRLDFPFLKQVYERYHTQGLEIINVSTDEDLDAWQKAIAAEDIGMWRQVSDKQNSNAVSPFYFVTGIPVKVLIDKQGKIIARWRGSSKENKDALEEMLQSIFEQKSDRTLALTNHYSRTDLNNDFE